MHHCLIIYLVILLSAPTEVDAFDIDIIESTEYSNIDGHTLHVVKPSSFATDQGNASRMKAEDSTAEDNARHVHVSGAYKPAERKVIASESLRSTEGKHEKIDVFLNNKKREHASGYKGLNKNTFAKAIIRKFDIRNIISMHAPEKESEDVSNAGKHIGGLPLMKRIFGDAGYGSRVGTASKIAIDVDAIKQLFGSSGPGRRR